MELERWWLIKLKPGAGAHAYHPSALQAGDGRRPQGSLEASMAPEYAADNKETLSPSRW